MKSWIEPKSEELSYFHIPCDVSTEDTYLRVNTDGRLRGLWFSVGGRETRSDETLVLITWRRLAQLLLFHKKHAP